MGEPWGQQVTAHVYRAGLFTDEDLERLSKAIESAIPDTHFIGLFLNDVQDEPRESGDTG